MPRGAQCPQPVQAPAGPLNLRVTSQGWTAILLIWDGAAGGDEVRNYIVERRGQQIGNDDFGQWMIVGSVLSNEIELKNQPRPIQLEHRVKATNTGDQSPPGDTIAVIL